MNSTRIEEIKQLATILLNDCHSTTMFAAVTRLEEKFSIGAEWRDPAFNAYSKLQRHTDLIAEGSTIHKIYTAWEGLIMEPAKARVKAKSKAKQEEFQAYLANKEALQKVREDAAKDLVTALLLGIAAPFASLALPFMLFAPLFEKKSKKQI